MTKNQVMQLAQAIAAHKQRVFGDTCLITALTNIIRDVTEERFDNALGALQWAESHLIEVVNLLDQANDRYKTTTALGQRADALLGDVQKLAEWMTREPEPVD